MKKRFKQLIVMSLALIPVVNANAAVCDLGPIMFRDMLYGTAIGTGVSGLVMIANQSDSNRIAPNLAIGALIGLGVGAITGVLELSLSGDCSSASNKSYSYLNQKGFHVEPLVTLMKPENLSYTKLTSSFDDFKNTFGMGLHFKYNFAD